MSLMSDIGAAVKSKIDSVVSTLNTSINNVNTTLTTSINTETTTRASHISVPTAYHIYNGNVTATNTVITAGFATTLYTGNGSTQSITTGVDMATQWGNDVSEKFGGLVWCKARTQPQGNTLLDTIRGVTKMLGTHATAAEYTDTTSVTAFNSTGFSTGSYIGTNQSTTTYVSWNFQTTHRKTGTTNHGKAYTEHYNPFTGFTIIQYAGSGIAGHEIPHSLGRKLGFYTVKNLSATSDWLVKYLDGNNSMYLSNTSAQIVDNGIYSGIGDDSKIPLYAVNNIYNDVSKNFILYGWANSYYDEANTLIGNYEIGVYQGTGAAGNKVTTRGKPAWLMLKRLDATGGWNIVDVLRGLFDYTLQPNLSNAEFTGIDFIDAVSDGFIHKSTVAEWNASGGQYLYMVVYDNDSGSGKSKYPKATDTTNLSINALVPYANGIDVNGSKVSIEYKNETITGLTLTQGKNYLYSKNDGTYGVKPYEPRYLSSELVRRFAGEQPDYYDANKNKWFNTDAGSELVTNGKFDVNTTGWTVSGGGTLISSNGYGLVTVNTGSSFVTIEQNITIENKQHIIFFTGSVIADTNNNTSGRVLVQISQGSNLIHNVWYWYNNVDNVIIPLSGITGNISIKLTFNYNTTAQAKYRIDNISVFPTDILPTTEITESRNYLNHIVHADQNGQVEYVEQLPKVNYFDEVKANDFRGKNACTAWVNFDGTTTPPTIRDSYNVASVVRTATGYYDIYFKESMNNGSYSVYGTGFSASDGYTRSIMREATTVGSLNRVRVTHSTGNAGAYQDGKYIDIQILGGKN